MPTVPTSSAPVATNQTSFSVSSRSTDSVTRRRMRAASLAEKSSSPIGSSPAQPPFQPSPPSSSSSSVAELVPRADVGAGLARVELVVDAEPALDVVRPLPSSSCRAPARRAALALARRLLGRGPASGRRARARAACRGPSEHVGSAPAASRRDRLAPASLGGLAGASGPTAAKSIVSNSSSALAALRADAPARRTARPTGSRRAARSRCRATRPASTRAARPRERRRPRARPRRRAAPARTARSRSATRRARRRGCGARRASRRRPTRCRWRRRRTASAARGAR